MYYTQCISVFHMHIVYVSVSYKFNCRQQMLCTLHVCFLILSGGIAHLAAIKDKNYIIIILLFINRDTGKSDV